MCALGVAIPFRAPGCASAVVAVVLSLPQFRDGITALAEMALGPWVTAVFIWFRVLGSTVESLLLRLFVVSPEVCLRQHVPRAPLLPLQLCMLGPFLGSRRALPCR